ncbi:hypothetical protein BC941DRAFT_418801 [Chlamydoabsidia padenii]|nr:hypothetical protein BC941DRAFT_418801 [Chlamydoabsidia padenii]
MSTPNESETELNRLEKFVGKAPGGFYTIDQKENELCHQLGNGQKDCVKLKLEYTEMFSEMQKLGFFCALPMDPTQIHMECRRV